MPAGRGTGSVEALLERQLEELMAGQWAEGELASGVR